MLKKIFTFFLIFISINNIFLFAYEKEEDIDLNSIEVSTNATDIPNINSRYAIVIDRTTKTILYEKNAYTKTAMASTTKIMTAILAIENCNLSDLVEISKKAASTGGSTLGIKSETQLSIETLLYGLLLRSGNDCAVAIAEHISGNTEDFACLMNSKAKELNLINTHFVTPHGLDSDLHFTTTYDLASLTVYALNNPTFSKIVATKTCTIDLNGYPKTITNTHELLGYTEGVYGVKTGFTGNAGRCLVTACKRNNLDIIIVVLGADTKKIRTTDTLNLINYIYANFEIIDTKDILNSEFETKQKTINISNSHQKATLVLDKLNNYTYPINKNNTHFSSSIYILENQNAPLEKNQKLGIIKILLNGSPLYEIDVLSAEDIPKYNYKEYLIIVLNEFKELFSN